MSQEIQLNLRITIKPIISQHFDIFHATKVVNLNNELVIKADVNKLICTHHHKMGRNIL